MVEPYGYAFQHEDTGLQQVVDIQQVEWGFEKNNPRWERIGPVYFHPPALVVAPSTVSQQEVRKALEPFANAANAYDPLEGDDHLEAWASKFKLGELRAARDLLNRMGHKD
jgi:hypothetical protein